MELRSEESGRANEMKMAIERLDRECCKNKKISDEQDKTINEYTAKIEEKKRELDELTEYFKKFQNGKEESDVKKEVLPVVNGLDE
ncbi:hypothetical protein GCK72_023097 [Caenorhabditis remanei]|uniref:Uncharacterized protein n=1 Tax=Caenorhabditis remanei TaxID=31234 RepID=A0A6A5FVH9_CAERE|nr:hypothetical protein GCK72_023097 [Caenorhabditis remanei]KAF1746640.1 hypothetical protein GCK72_023097 [Caenorhabditis remanei]